MWVSHVSKLAEAEGQDSQFWGYYTPIAPTIPFDLGRLNSVRKPTPDRVVFYRGPATFPTQGKGPSAPNFWEPNIRPRGMT